MLAFLRQGITGDASESVSGLYSAHNTDRKHLSRVSTRYDAAGGGGEALTISLMALQGPVVHAMNAMNEFVARIP